MTTLPPGRRRCAVAPAAVCALLALGGCARSPDGSGTGSTAPSAPLTRAIGESCTWQGGLTISVTAAYRDDRDLGDPALAGYSVDIRVANHTPTGYAVAALQTVLWVGPDRRRADPDRRPGLGTGMDDVVAAPGRTVTGSFGFTIPRVRAADRVAVGLRPSPVDQQCVLRGSDANVG